ncbi:MAG: hypothetical protein Ctma_0936 [Catillopecten margaritatus gill symbiont]|uniref:DUF898 domain-containing protein n=1 Tax=Catillopecten margaritatus gill symbiont TaxID=3083288 RepID=A0AAU6PGQ8_9GAMM
MRLALLFDHKQGVIKMKAFNFTGNGWEYFKIWIVNILLTIITLGLYYPWAKVRNYRYFYANSQFGNAGFDYHATGKQLFMGYLIALVLFFIYQLLSNLVPITSVPILIILFLAIPWVIWRSVKFSMRMTSYANVRFSFEGELSQSYLNFFIYPIITLLAYAAPIIIFSISESLLFASISAVIFWSISIYMYVLTKQKNNSYLINGLHYGQGVFKTQLDTQTFLMIALKAIGIMLAGTLAFIALSLLILGISPANIDTLSAEFFINSEYFKIAILFAYPLLLVFYTFVNSHHKCTTKFN